METRVESEFGKPLPTAIPVTKEEAKGTFADVLRPPYLKRTLIRRWSFIFSRRSDITDSRRGFPSLIIAAGITTTLSLRYSFLIALAAPLGPMLAMGLADRFERKWQIVASAICIAVFGLLFAVEQSEPRLSDRVRRDADVLE